MNHDRIHARRPAHDVEKWTPGTVVSIAERDGHGVVEVRPESGERVALVVTVAVMDLFVRRLELDPDETPVGETVWYRKRGG